MQTCFYNTNLQSLRAANLGVMVYSVYESIVIDKIAINGLTNFGIEIKNNSASGNVTQVLIYGSPNGVEYFPLQPVFNGSIGPGELEHCDFVLVSGFVRVTVTTDADVNISVYLHGNIT